MILLVSRIYDNYFCSFIYASFKGSIKSSILDFLNYLYQKFPFRNQMYWPCEASKLIPGRFIQLMSFVIVDIDKKNLSRPNWALLFGRNKIYMMKLFYKINLFNWCSMSACGQFPYLCRQCSHILFLFVCCLLLNFQ